MALKRKFGVKPFQPTFVKVLEFVLIAYIYFRSEVFNLLYINPPPSRQPRRHLQSVHARQCACGGAGSQAARRAPVYGWRQERCQDSPGQQDGG